MKRLPDDSDGNPAVERTDAGLYEALATIERAVEARARPANEASRLDAMHDFYMDMAQRYQAAMQMEFDKSVLLYAEV